MNAVTNERKYVQLSTLSMCRPTVSSFLYETFMRLRFKKKKINDVDIPRQLYLEIKLHLE